MLQIFIKDIFPQNNNFPYFHFYNEKLLILRKHT